MAPPRKSSRENRRDQRREELKRAAIDVFYDHGYRTAKVSDIVQQVGVAQGTFYLYFEGKQQLFGEILVDFLELVVETVSSWEPAAIDSREVLTKELTRVGMLLTEVLLDNPKLTAIFFKEALAAAPEFDETIRQFYATLAIMLTEFNSILHQRGLIAKMNFRILAAMTIGMVERVILEHIVYGNLGDPEPREVVEHLVLHYMAGTIEVGPDTI
jgi:AcrR family transcriptional regulator